MATKVFFLGVVLALKMMDGIGWDGCGTPDVIIMRMTVASFLKGCY